VNERITIYGKIGFEPENRTNKHRAQASWKKVAMVFIDGDICEYYAWFLQKRYNIVLNKPLRGGHISFINDSMRDFRQNGTVSDADIELKWEATKKKWNGQIIPIVLDVSPKTDDRSWWLNVPNDERVLLHDIRAELGLGRPYFGIHMSIGYANERNIEHSTYIHDIIKKGFIG